MNFDYLTLNNFLDGIHPNLSSYWTTMTPGRSVSKVVYILADGSDSVVLISNSGTCIISDQLLREMRSI